MEQKQKEQDQAVVDSEGNEFGVNGQEVSLPDRPKDLLEQIDAAQAAQLDKYGGLTVWVCDEGPSRCGEVNEQNGHNCPCRCGQKDPDGCCGWYLSHEYMLSELEAGTADMKGPWSASQQKDLFGYYVSDHGQPAIDPKWEAAHGK